MKGGDLIKLLEKEGWVLDRISGSHHIMVKDKMRSI
ncbi:MAG TPA: type II toxin-antitoxin system HicA family toxin, partial [Ignavibacteria bacterium]|nr:type II toxin-antitoxin system HicA family toxin [Ignavibacteria bacterium]